MEYDCGETHGAKDRDGQGAGEAHGRTRIVPAGVPVRCEVEDQRLNVQRPRTDNAIGHYPSMGLAEARTAAFEQ